MHIGILYPTWWFGDPEAFALEVAAIEALDSQIRVHVEPYEDPHAVRTAKGGGDTSAWQPLEPTPTEEQLAAIAPAEILLAIDAPSNVTTLAPGLRWVQAVGAGTDQFGPCNFAEAGITVTSNGGANATGIAEFAIGRLIEANKHFAALRERQTEHDWAPQFGQQLAGQTLGLIGYGAIASAIAHRARAFDMKVHVVRSSTAATPGIDQQFRPEQLHDMLGSVDAVIAAVPDSPTTRGMIDADALAAMRPGAFFCNVGRGSLVDEGALIAALESGHLGSAALDVAGTEPLPADDPLWDAPRLSLSYHCASIPSAMFVNVHKTFRTNLEHYLKGEPLEHRV